MEPVQTAGEHVIIVIIVNVDLPPKEYTSEERRRNRCVHVGAIEVVHYKRSREFNPNSL